MSLICKDPVMLNQWQPICSLDDINIAKRTLHTMLLGEKISYMLSGEKQVLVWRKDVECEKLPTKLAYGFVWVCLGEPPKTFFSLPEFDEPDRRNVSTGAFGVNVSPGRAVENFLDMGHFPYVHTGILGEEPHTEVKDYDVEIRNESDEVIATNCKFYQPRANVASTGGNEVDYIYRVPHVNCALLYKSSPKPDRLDVIVMYCQPMTEEWIRAHTGMCIIDDSSTEKEIRLFQHLVFGQDKPILENQYPKRLPLDPRMETPIRADKVAIAYRRWLSNKGVKYGTIN